MEMVVLSGQNLIFIDFFFFFFFGKLHLNYSLIWSCVKYQIRNSLIRVCTVVQELLLSQSLGNYSVVDNPVCQCF